MAWTWSFTVRADDDLLKTYLTLQNGIAPTLFGAEFDSQKDLISYRIKSFTEDWTANLRERSVACERYGAALIETLSQIDQNLRTLGPAPEGLESNGLFLQRIRLHLLIPALFNLHALFSRKSEAGFGTLDRRQKLSCRMQDRAKVQLSFDQLIQQVATFHRQGLGNPGLLGFDAMSDRLLEIADTNENHRAYLSWILLGATTVASIIFWEMAPPAVALAARGAFGSVPAAFSNGYVIFGVRSATLMGEGLGYWALDRKINPPQPQYEPGVLGSWDEQMSEVEHLLASPVNSPELDYSFINQIKAQLARLYAPWIEKHASDLAKVVERLP
jgi:hypothetical protein